MGVQVVSQSKPLHILYILRFATGKNYVGQTVQGLNTRLGQHRKAARRGSELPVHCAWRKHGEPAVEVLGEYGTVEELHCAEIAAIANLGTLRPGGYNVGLGGETAPAKNPEVAKRISASLRGREFSEESRARMSAAAKRRGISPETLAKLAHASRTVPRAPASDEKRRSLSASGTAAWADPAKRERLTAARKTAWETRRKKQMEAAL